MAKRILYGIPVSAGIATGKAFFLHSRRSSMPSSKPIAADQAAVELEKFNEARANVLVDLKTAQSGLPEKMKDQAAIIATHIMIAQDPRFIGGVSSRITDKHMAAGWALDETVTEIAAQFSKIEDPYIRDSIQEVYLVADRILDQLSGYKRRRVRLPRQVALLARDLSPADTLELSPENLLCLVTEEGGKTSHTGILARGLGVPCVVGVLALEASVPDNATIIVDGLKGVILVEPDQDELAEYTALAEQFNAYRDRIKIASTLPAETVDQFKAKVQANVTWQQDLPYAVNNGCEGIGLYRTEFAFLNRTTAPDEEELYQEYARALNSIPGEVCFRTLDLGADKVMPDLEFQVEPNPALGLRGIRYCLSHPDLFKVQLKALLRAAHAGRASIMFPMMADLLELKRSLRLIQEARRELNEQGIPCSQDLPIGMMVELPAAILTAGVLAQEADFFSIGTNDLIQYTLGVDRNNHQVAHLYQPLHPAVLMSIKQIVEAGHNAGIPVAVCGEMASDPFCLPVLIGLGVDSFSVNPIAVPGIKNIIRSLSRGHCLELVDEVLACQTVGHINRVVRRFMETRAPEDVAFHSSLLGTEEQLA